jgi:hypothetical protein
MTRLGFAALLATLSLAAAGCSGSDTTPTTTPALPTVTETLTGTVPAAVNGVQQTSFVKFNVAGAGAGSATLTKAIETFPSGVIDPTVTVGLSLGAPDSTGTVCNVISGSLVTTSASPSPFSITFVAPGTVCIQVSDQTVQDGPVAYTLVVVHP